MKLKIINSNSAGNAYILENEHEALLIECGVHFDKIKQALNFNLKKIVGCILTHDHGDHSKSIARVLSAGINVYATEGTFNALGCKHHHRAVITASGDEFRVGSFRIKPFDVKHDVAEAVGFLIYHDETGKVLFLTDSYFCEYTFSGLNNIIIEANYCQSILDQRVKDGANPKFLRDRVITSHMSLATCKQMLGANDLSQVNNIVLVHLSDGNSDEKRFKKEVEEQTGKVVSIANAGMVIDHFNKQPF
ncbi:MAG: MBL fold metallo-hydrolase [Chitinophagaceae bacterium]|nr:MBL fold metallo-hydrolase [Chitinophagaceae bacterium]